MKKIKVAFVHDGADAPMARFDRLGTAVFFNEDVPAVARAKHTPDMLAAIGAGQIARAVEGNPRTIKQLSMKGDDFATLYKEVFDRLASNT